MWQKINQLEDFFFFVENGSLSPPHLPVTDVKKKKKKKSKNKNLQSTSLTNGTPNSSDSLKADQSVEDEVMEQKETQKKKKDKVCVFLYGNGNSTSIQGQMTLKCLNNVFLMYSLSPKKRTKTSRLVKLNCFVRFLGEREDTFRHFEIN